MARKRAATDAGERDKESFEALHGAKFNGVVPELYDERAERDGVRMEVATNGMRGPVFEGRGGEARKREYMRTYGKRYFESGEPTTGSGDAARAARVHEVTRERMREFVASGRADAMGAGFKEKLINKMGL